MLTVCGAPCSLPENLLLNWSIFRSGVPCRVAVCTCLWSSRCQLWLILVPEASVHSALIPLRSERKKCLWQICPPPAHHLTVVPYFSGRPRLLLRLPQLWSITLRPHRLSSCNQSQFFPKCLASKIWASVPNFAITSCQVDKCLMMRSAGWHWTSAQVLLHFALHTPVLHSSLLCLSFLSVPVSEGTSHLQKPFFLHRSLLTPLSPLLLLFWVVVVVSQSYEYMNNLWVVQLKFANLR